MAARPPMNKEQMPMAEGETPMPMQGGMETADERFATAGATGRSGMGAMPQGVTTSGETEEAENVSPEEKAIYHKFMENYYTVMYVGGKGEAGKDQPPLADDVRQHFVNIKEPVDALANAALVVVKELSGSAAAAGKPIPGDVLMHAGTEVISDLAQLAEDGGHHEYTKDEVTGAYTKAVDLYREMNQDSLNMDEIGQDYKTLTEADQAGRLGEVLPGAEEAAERLPKPEAEGEPMPTQGTQPQGGFPQKGMV